MLAALSFVLFNNMLQKSVSIGYPSRERIHLSLKIQDWRTVEVEALVRARLDLINPYIINNHDQIDLWMFCYHESFWEYSFLVILISIRLWPDHKQHWWTLPSTTSFNSRKEAHARSSRSSFSHAEDLLLVHVIWTTISLSASFARTLLLFQCELEVCQSRLSGRNDAADLCRCDKIRRRNYWRYWYGISRL